MNRLAMTMTALALLAGCAHKDVKPVPAAAPSATEAATLMVAKKPTSTGELVEISKPSDWRVVDQKNLLYLDIPQGRVLIELSPEYAPKHVDRIRKLAREKYWDGLAIMRVQDNYVVQWGDQNGEKPELKRKPKTSMEVLPPELEIDTPKKIAFHALPDGDVYTKQTGFTNGMAAGRDATGEKTWLLHCYGAIGVGRDMRADSGDGTELYVVIGNAPRHLDRNVAIVGHVLEGMEFLSSLSRGHATLGFYDTEKGEKQITIKSIHLGSELPKAERVNLEVMRTDTPLFDQLIDIRRNLPNEWFVFKTGRADACNFAIPVRVAK